MNDVSKAMLPATKDSGRIACGCVKLFVVGPQVALNHESRLNAYLNNEPSRRLIDDKHPSRRLSQTKACHHQHRGGYKIIIINASARLRAIELKQPWPHSHPSAPSAPCAPAWSAPSSRVTPYVFLSPSSLLPLEAKNRLTFVQRFRDHGCPNCEEFLHLAGSQDQIEACTSQVFEGVITLADPSKSWVAKWQRLDNYLPGVYATKVSGQLPDEVRAMIEDEYRIPYIP